MDPYQDKPFTSTLKTVLVQLGFNLKRMIVNVSVPQVCSTISKINSVTSKLEY